jgi:phosphoadenylyl-sulfate reductase (thioredoxin)
MSADSASLESASLELVSLSPRRTPIDTRNLTAEQEEVARWAAELEPASPDGVLTWAYERFGEELAVVTSFQDEGMVILDKVHRLDLPLRVITLDTGRLPEATYELIDRVRLRWGIEVEIIFPEHAAVQVLTRRGINMFLDSVENRLECCHVRKVEPFRRAVEGLGAWTSGVRREHSDTRREVRKVELDSGNRPQGGLYKVNPLADWSEKQVWEYVRENGVPYHAYYDQGYRSIGCAPCTRPTRPGEDERGGRWWWEQGAKECGLHLAPVGGARTAGVRR